MASEEVIKQAAAMVVNVDEDKTKNVSLGSLAVDGWDAQKALNIAAAVIPCLNASFASMRHSPVYQVLQD